MIQALLVTLNSDGTLKTPTIDDQSADGYIRINDIQICWGRASVNFSNDNHVLGAITCPAPFRDFLWAITMSCYYPGVTGFFSVGQSATKTIQIATIDVFDVHNQSRSGVVYIDWVAVGLWQ